MIELKSVSAGYGKCGIVHDVSLTIPEGKVTALIGRNGSGKSTLLKAMLGFIPRSGGDILFNGIPLNRMSRAEIAREIAYLPQGKNVPDISAGRMVLHGRFPYLKYPRKYREQDFVIAEDAMRQMGISGLAQKRMAELSGGMRQKVYIAMALAQQAPAIVMDEPTTYLDIGEQFKFAGMVRQLSESGKTVLLVLHDILLALKISDQVAAMQQGRILQCGTPGEMVDSNVTGRLYGVAVKSFRTDRGVQYYYEADGESL